MSRFRNSLWANFEIEETSKLLNPSVVSVSKFAFEFDIDNVANFETTTLVGGVPCPILDCIMP